MKKYLMRGDIAPSCFSSLFHFNIADPIGLRQSFYHTADDACAFFLCGDNTVLYCGNFLIR